jgi:phosphoketolase
MLGAVRQCLIFSRQKKQAERLAGWLGWTLVATSHTWESDKNQQSHQDTTFCEALLGGMSDMVRVLFPAHHNSVLACLPAIYQGRGQLACMVITKREQETVFSQAQPSSWRLMARCWSSNYSVTSRYC